MNKNDFGFNTLQLHAGQDPDPVTGSRAVPIYQTTSYVFNDSEHAADLFALKEPGNIYTRIMNPTTDVLEKRMAVLEGGVGALAVASGSAAVMYSILNIASYGDEIIASSTLYGGTYTLFASTFKKFGITTHFVNSENIDDFKKAINSKTKAIFIETIGNPTINIADIESIAKIAHESDLPLIVDNTFATPYLCRPIEYGADIIVHSATKFIGGHGTSIGGIIVDSGKFDWKKSNRFESLTKPDPTYHDVIFTKEFGESAYIVKARVQLLRDTGACISPFNSFLLLQGLETLSLRVERHVANSEKIAEYLESHPMVDWIAYPYLNSNKYNSLAKKYLPKGSGSILTFGIKGGLEAGKLFIESLNLFSHLANVADAKSLIIHPASTTHAQLSEQEQKSAGITPEMIRLSVGLEDVSDLINDLEQAFVKVKNNC